MHNFLNAVILRDTEVVYLLKWLLLYLCSRWSQALINWFLRCNPLLILRLLLFPLLLVKRQLLIVFKVLCHPLIRRSHDLNALLLLVVLHLDQPVLVAKILDLVLEDLHVILSSPVDVFNFCP